MSGMSTPLQALIDKWAINDKIDVKLIFNLILSIMFEGALRIDVFLNRNLPYWLIINDQKHSGIAQ